MVTGVYAVLLYLGEGIGKLIGLRNSGRSQKFFVVMVELILDEIFGIED